jgi:hypothetical protein
MKRHQLEEIQSLSRDIKRHNFTVRVNRPLPTYKFQAVLVHLLLVLVAMVASKSPFGTQFPRSGYLGQVRSR